MGAVEAGRLLWHNGDLAQARLHAEMNMLHGCQLLAGPSHIVGVEWYDGVEGFAEPNCPVLALCLDNGRMQLMRYESDDNAVCIDTGIKPCKCKWNMNGTILAVAGYQLGGGGETHGQHGQARCRVFYNSSSIVGKHAIDRPTIVE